MGFDDCEGSLLAMVQKKSDSALFFLAVFALGLGVFVFVKHRKPSSQLSLKKELQIIGIIRESDCVECVRKVVCFWERISSDFNAQGIETQIVFGKETEHFQIEELEFLCTVPENLQVIPLPKMTGFDLLPMATPSVLVTDGENILHLEPVFLQTDMEQVHHRIASSIHLFLPHANE